MELLLPGFVVPLLSGNERRHKVRFSGSSWISVVVGSELTETFCAAACNIPRPRSQGFRRRIPAIWVLEIPRPRWSRQE